MKVHEKNSQEVLDKLYALKIEDQKYKAMVNHKKKRTLTDMKTFNVREVDQIKS